MKSRRDFWSKKVFPAYFCEVDPRSKLPLYMALGVLGSHFLVRGKAPVARAVHFLSRHLARSVLTSAIDTAVIALQSRSGPGFEPPAVALPERD